jgi:beta-glucosidase-like glycosyl hydrolase
MTEHAELLLPAIRWNAESGYEPARVAIDHALELGVGGFILFGGPADKVREMTAELRRRSRTPLLIGADLERGAGQQFAGATGLPPLAAIGSLDDAGAIVEAARVTAIEARSLGINWIYAPVCDLDIEPENPIVGTRSFGSDPARVGVAVSQWIDACQDIGVLACAKHFPGHGRTTADSHAELPVVTASENDLALTDLVPFEAAIDAGVAAVMTAHVAFPALDPSGMPATLSSVILDGRLRGEMGFAGLVVTDALIMEGVLGGGEATAVVRALHAGCDLLLYPTDLHGCLTAIDNAVTKGDLDSARIDQSLMRRRRWAEWAAAKRDDRGLAEEELRWAERIAERVVRTVRGEATRLQGDVEVVIVDDDLGGPYPAPSREPFVATLKERGIDVATAEPDTAASRGSRVIALFGDIRSWKGRPGYSSKSIDLVKAALAGAARGGADSSVVQFSHPRLAAQIPGNGPVICAWGGEAVMQRAAARVLAAGGSTG